MSDLFTNILTRIVNTFPNSGALQVFNLATEISDIVDSDREVNHPTVDFNSEYVESAQVAALREQVAQLTADRDRAVARVNAYARAIDALPRVSQSGDSAIDVVAKLQPNLLALAAANLKIPAIKLVRVQANCNLLEAKKAVDDAWPILRAEAQHAARTANQRL